jgi:hypothetical protein
MNQYIEIVCTTQVPFGNPPSCARIVTVGILDGGMIKPLAVDTVITYMDAGFRFFVKGEISEKIAFVEKYWCPRCQRYHIRSEADTVKDNNLDYLQYCPWRKAA